MRLTELKARFWATEGRHGMGVNFECPRCTSRHMMSVAFSNPVDGGSPYELPDAKLWLRQGDTIDTLTLHPSIDGGSGCWHGFITNGDVA
jgi:Family of unknown function (DUF6527)